MNAGMNQTVARPLKNRKKQGITIVETLVSLLLFATFLGGACKALLIHREVIDVSRDHYTAVNIARNQVEQIRNTMKRIGYDQIFNLEENKIQVASNGEVSRYGKFRRTTAISEISDVMAEIEIKIEILDRKNLTFSDDKKEVLRTYLARPL